MSKEKTVSNEIFILMATAFSILSPHARAWVLGAKGILRAGLTSLKANLNPRILPARFTFTEAV